MALEGDRNHARSVRVELLAVAVVLVLASFLRLHALDLVEFKLDEATAVDRARRLLDGAWPTVGLTSSVGALNPPFFIYLIALPLALHDDPLTATAFIGFLAVVAVALTYVVLRPRFGAFVAVSTAAFFATAPWAALYGRKIWAQDALPIVDVLLLWSLLVVLERRGSRGVLLVPVLFSLAFQLNFATLALLVPIAVVLAYRAREVDWLLFAAGTGCALLLLGPWFGHELTHGFEDVGRLLSEGRGDRGSTPLGAGAGDAIQQTVNLLGGWNWGYVTGASREAFATDAGWAWTYGWWASTTVTSLLVVGFATCVLRVALGVRRRPGWPWIEVEIGARRRLLLLVWLLGIWLSYTTSGRDRIYPHYFIDTYPVSFAVAAVGLADIVGVLRRRTRCAPLVAVSVIAAVVAGYTAFMVAFLGFLDREGGASGDYGVVYRDQRDLARAMRRHGVGVADQPVLQLLATGAMEKPKPETPLLHVQNMLVDKAPAACTGDRRSFGPLLACFPPGSR